MSFWGYPKIGLKNGVHFWAIFGDPKNDPKMAIFGVILGPKNGPKMGPFLGQKLAILMGQEGKLGVQKWVQKWAKNGVFWAYWKSVKWVPVRLKVCVTLNGYPHEP